MFKTAAAKIAHNSTLPSLGGNQDLRPLQDLITAEKSVLIALQKLSVDFSKSSEALRTWGLNEGDDLGDILSASTTILNHFSSALSQYAAHGHSMRDQLKAIRTREEGLEELKRRRRTVARKADDADKKLSKMSPEHKNLPMQTDLLNRLRDEIRSLDSEIMTEEAALGDFKRTSTRMWMGLKFGGLLELCEKGAIVAEFGKMIIGEISEEVTQPGLPRSLYYGQSKTENYVAEAHRCINEVVFSTVPSAGIRDRRQYEQTPQEASFQPSNDAYPMNTGPWTPTDGKPQPPPPIHTSEDQFSQRQFTPGNAGSPVAANTNFNFSSTPTQASTYQPSSFHPEPHTVDDFGVNTRTPGLIDNSSTAGGRFATFPVKRPTDPSTYTIQGPTPGASRHGPEQSLSDSIAAALGGERAGIAGEGSYSQPAGNWSAPAQGPVYSQDMNSRAPETPTNPQFQPQQPWGGNDQRHESSPNIVPAGPRQYHSTAPLPPPPPGAAPPDISDPWASPNRNDSLQPIEHPNEHNRNVSEISANDALLAYMTNPEPSSPQTASHSNDGGLSAQAYDDEQQRISRHVRFGEVEDVQHEMEVRKSLEQSKQDPVKAEEAKQGNQAVPEPVAEANPAPEPASEEPVEKGPSPALETSSTHSPKYRRVPPPTFEPQQDNETALDAAAAREITKELEALRVSPPQVTDAAKPQEQNQPTPDLSIETASSLGNDTTTESVTSLPPPSAPFAQRAVSPHPYADLNSNSNSTPPYLGGYTAAQSYAQAYQGPNAYSASPSSPAQAYAQSYQATQQPSDSHATPAQIPPRFQALNQEIQVPPRFQGTRAHSPGSPNASQVPPRFQSGGAPQIPPTVALPELPEMRFGTGPETPYRTPPEYPRAAASPYGAGSPYAKSASSFTSPASAPGGARTISAAAFKRPRNPSADNLGGQADPFKRSLPSSPYPVRDAGSAPTGGAGAATASSVSSLPPGAGPGPMQASVSSLPPGAGPPGTAPGRKSILDDEEFDYISAYVNSNPSSPQRSEFEKDGGTMAGVGSGGGKPGGGYGEGRFTTDLDGSLR